MAGFKGLRSIFKVCGYQLSLQLHEARTKVLFLMVFLYLSGIMSPLKDFSINIDQGVSPWVFPVLMNDPVCPFVIFFLWCFLICDTPFCNEGYLYYAGRAGKKNWIWGEILFLLVFSGIYMLAVNVFLWIAALPRLELTMEWGKTLGTLAYTDAAGQFVMPLAFPATMMSSTTPVMALLLSFLLAWSVAFLLALCILVINWGLKTSWGVVFSMVLVFLDLTVYNIYDGVWWRYSPVSLGKLSMLLGSYDYLTPLWAMTFLAGILVILLGTVFISTKLRKGIE